MNNQQIKNKWTEKVELGKPPEDGGWVCADKLFCYIREEEMGAE